MVSALFGSQLPQNQTDYFSSAVQIGAKLQQSRKHDGKHLAGAQVKRLFSR